MRGSGCNAGINMKCEDQDAILELHKVQKLYIIHGKHKMLHKKNIIARVVSVKSILSFRMIMELSLMKNFCPRC